MSLYINDETFHSFASVTYWLRNLLGEEMDGEAVLGALGCQVGPDCLKAILPKYGQRIKVYNTIKAAVGTVPPQEVFKLLF